MILTKKKDYMDGFAKIAYTLSYMKGEPARIWLRNSTRARNIAND